MHRIITPLVSVVAVCLLFPACGGDESTNPASSQDLIPLSPGTAWDYINYDGDFGTDQEQVIGEWTLEIQGATELNGAPAIATNTEGMFFKEIPEGVALILFWPTDLGEVMITIPLHYPIQDSDSYQVELGEGGDPIDVTVTAEDVVVPAGQFETLKYSFDNDGGDPLWIWVAPQIGMVQIVWADMDDITRLASYRIG